MRLRQLVIKGFKSFPDRTSLVFPIYGISAIVGPNGCGKSNILDAIRWVLGEQSPKMLRAKNMEDVIYSGPNGRQVGYAEVQMVLELTSGKEKKKVEVARRLYKSGEAKYLIDGRAVRLKDILYLFMDTGTGTRAYALVDQGQVARFVEMGPDDRKALIEEAAGISKYKLKRKETESRLQKTTENMERLGDLLAEIQREHAHAAKEAATARQYMALEGRLETYKKALLAWCYAELLDKKKALAEENSVLLKGLSSVERELRGKKDELKELEQLIEENDVQYEGLQEEENELFNQKERIEHAISQKRKTTLDLKQRYREKTLRKGDLDARVQGLRKKKASLEAHLGRVVEAISGLKSAYKEEEAKYRRLFSSVGALKKAVDAIKDDIVDAKSNLARVEGEERSIVARRDDYLRRQDAIRKRLKDLDEKESELLRRLNHYMYEIKVLEEEVSGQDAEINSLKKRLKALREEEATRRRLFNDIRSKLDSITHRLMAIKEIIDKGLDLTDQTRRALSVLQRYGISHQGLLVDHLQIESGWEQIVEYSLGRDFLQAIVIGSVGDLGAALEALATEGASGPIWFLSSKEGKKNDTPTSRRPVPLPIECNGSLHIHVTARMAPFLGSGLVEVEGDRIKGVDCALFLGGRARDEKNGLIQRRNELKRLSSLKDELTVQHHEASKLLEDTLSDISFVEEQLNESLVRLEAQKKRLSAAKTKLSKTEHELSTVKEQRDALVLEDKSILLDISGLDSEFQELKGRRDGLTRRLNQLEALLRDKLTTLECEEEGLRKLQSRLSRLKSDIVREETKMAELKKNVQSTEDTITRLTGEAKALQVKESMLKASLDESEAVLRRLQQDLDSIRDHLEGVREKKNRVYEALRAKRDEYMGLSSDIEKLEQRQKEILERVHKKDLLLSTVEQKIRALREEANEAFSQDLRDQWRNWAGLSELTPGELKRRIREVRHAIDELGPVNLGALKRLEELEERLNFMNRQMEDLRRSYQDLKKAISKIDNRCRTRLQEALDGINRELSRVFPLLFDGGSARLELTQEGDDILDKGVEFLVRLPGKAVKSLQLLSGGEKALSALSLIFSIFFLKPAPFCVLDEVDAALDEANCVRFSRLLKEIAKKCQVILITHNPRVMEAADRLYGVTMEERGVSKLVSVNLQ